MTLAPELMNAILSMDAYNRGYEASIVLSGTQIGAAAIIDDLGDASAQAEGTGC